MARDFSKNRNKKRTTSAASQESGDIAELLRGSAYLSQLAARWPDVLTSAPEAACRDILAAARSALHDNNDTATVMSVLRMAKQKTALAIAAADLRGLWDDMTVMRHLSALADFAVQTAVDALLRDAHRRKIIRLPTPATPQKNAGMCVIALGKWGAHELNYSSDIDLMVIFDPLRSPVRGKDETQNFFVRLTRELARMLEEPTADGYVFRCDLRLRPDPGAMPLAISIAAAETYYGSLGQNWERAAMIKARPVAGDAALSGEFTKLMQSWIWRRNLDFAAIQDIHSIKRQINAKQATQHRKRSDQNPFLGMNVKLGHGGIREIEFYAQTQQLIYGGRDQTLRCPATLDALAALNATGHITDEDRSALHEAYLFLRHIEHRLQMIDDRQTHSLPATAESFAEAAAFAGYDAPADLVGALSRHTGAVKKRYADLFIESQSLSDHGNLVFTGVDDDPETIDTLRGMGFHAPEKITAAIRGWHHGRYRAVRSERARQILTEITPHLLTTLGATAHPDDAFIRFDRFLEKLPSGIPIFSMFAKHPQQLALVADVMGSAPALADWLGTHPQVLDGVLSRDFFGRLPGLAYLQAQLSAQLQTARDYQDILDLTRRWARERRFHAGVHILKNLSPAVDCGRYLADIAEAALTTLIPHVETEFARTHGRFKTGALVILGMGSFAAREMFSDSDLDVIGLYQTDAAETASDGEKPLGASVYYIRLMQRLIAAIAAPTSESILYAVDARLRPAGDDGPLAVTVDGFFDYQRSKAWTWEHMSLIRSRIIYAPAAVKRSMAQKTLKVLSAARDANILAKDMRDMQARVRKQFGTHDPWDMKHRKGGVMDVMFALHYLALSHAATHKGLLQAALPDMIAALKSARKLSAADAKILTAACDHAQKVQMFLRLTAALPFDPATAAAGVKAQMAAHLSPAKRKVESFAVVTRRLQKIFADSDTTCRAILNGKKKK